MRNRKECSMTAKSKWRMLLPLVAFGITIPHRAYAATPQEQAAAQALYDEARTLIKAENFGPACPKLEESQRLEPTVVTLFHLATCYERTDRKASAWSAYLEVASASKRAGRTDREKLARDQAAALQPKLSKITLTVAPGARVEGLVVTRDGNRVGEGQWGTSIPVDNGKHVIEASAPGKTTWRDETNVKGDGATVSIDVPVLSDAPKQAPIAAAPAKRDSTAQTQASETTRNDGQSRRTLGYVLGGVGLVGVGVGAAFGFSALSKNAASNEPGRCTGNSCSAEGLEMRSSAVTSGNISTLALLGGGALVATGAVLWFSAPKSKVQAAPTVGGAMLRAIW